MSKIGAAVLAFFALVVLTTPVRYSLFFAEDKSDFTPDLRLPTNSSECVRPTDWMRKNHMTLLKSSREQIVRFGARGAANPGLTECRECHTSRAGFCDSCHQFAGVSPDCFGCHFYPVDDGAAMKVSSHE